jgi:hypothetical protein
VVVDVVLVEVEVDVLVEVVVGGNVVVDVLVVVLLDVDVDVLVEVVVNALLVEVDVLVVSGAGVLVNVEGISSAGEICCSGASVGLSVVPTDDSTCFWVSFTVTSDVVILSKSLLVDCSNWTDSTEEVAKFMVVGVGVFISYKSVEQFAYIILLLQLSYLPFH